MDGEPLDPGDARKAIISIRLNGEVSWDSSPNSHFQKEMAADGLTILDCMNVLRGGTVDPAEWNDQYEEFRYRVHTSRICVVVSFISEVELFIVTTWRKK